MNFLDLVGQRLPDLDEGPGTVEAVCAFNPSYVTVRLDDGRSTVRQAGVLLQQFAPDSHLPRRPVVAATAKPRKSSSTAGKSSPAKKPAPKKSAASWKELPDKELAAYLLDHVTLGDSQWSHRAGGKSRRKGEKRDAFIRRVLLGDEPESERVAS